MKNFDKEVKPYINTFVFQEGKKITEIEITDISVVVFNKHSRICISCRSDKELQESMILEPENALFVAEKIVECLKEREEK